MWYKAWTEVRWRLVLMALLNSFIAALLLDDVVSRDVWRNRLSGNLPTVFAMNAIVLASSGIASQLSQRPGQLVHPSMMFLLSLPIARKRIVLQRQAVGAISAVALLLVTASVYLMAAPEIRELFTVGTGALFVVCIVSATLTAYAASALLSTVLDQLWQTYGAMALVAVVLGVFPRARFWNILLYSNPLATSAAGIPWLSVATGLVACTSFTAAMVFVSVQIVKKKQF